MSTQKNLLEEGFEAIIDWKKLRKIRGIEKGLLPVVIQDRYSQEVLFVGYTNLEAMQKTLKTKNVTLWSTSRNELWLKGATSGNMLQLIEARVNCEQNSFLYLVRRVEDCGACHTMEAGEYRKSCYYRKVIVGDDGNIILSRIIS